MNAPESSEKPSIGERRTKLGWKQTDLARSAGCSQGVISLLETRPERVSEFIQHRVERVLNDAESRAKSKPSPAAPIGLERPASQLNIKRPAATWKELRYACWSSRQDSGDAVILLQKSRARSCLAINLDVVGHGIKQVPKAAYLLGWLHGWADSNDFEAPLEILLRALSERLETERVAASFCVARITPLPTAEHTALVQVACCGSPPPIFFRGTLCKAELPVAPGPTLPLLRDDAIDIEEFRLRPPWLLALGSDGVYARLGGTSENQGARVLVKQVGQSLDLDDITAYLDQKPSFELASIQPRDDESMLLIEWNHWDATLTRENEFRFWLTDKNVLKAVTEDIVAIVETLVKRYVITPALNDLEEPSATMQVRIVGQEIQLQLDGEATGNTKLDRASILEIITPIQQFIVYRLVFSKRERANRFRLAITYSFSEN